MSWDEYHRALRLLAVALLAAAGVAAIILAFVAGCVYLAGNWPS